VAGPSQKMHPITILVNTNKSVRLLVEKMHSSLHVEINHVLPVACCRPSLKLSLDPSKILVQFFVCFQSFTETKLFGS